MVARAMRQLSVVDISMRCLLKLWFFVIGQSDGNYTTFGNYYAHVLATVDGLGHLYWLRTGRDDYMYFSLLCMAQPIGRTADRWTGSLCRAHTS